jgi:hypothetical protein
MQPCSNDVGNGLIPSGRDTEKRTTQLPSASDSIIKDTFPLLDAGDITKRLGFSVYAKVAMTKKAKTRIHYLGLCKFIYSLGYPDCSGDKLSIQLVPLTKDGFRRSFVNKEFQCPVLQSPIKDVKSLKGHHQPAKTCLPDLQD